MLRGLLWLECFGSLEVRRVWCVKCTFLYGLFCVFGVFRVFSVFRGLVSLCGSMLYFDFGGWDGFE